MHDNFDKLAADSAFRKRASAMKASVPAGNLQPIDDVFEHLQRFASIRRREARIVLLTDAGRIEGDNWQAHRERVPDAIISMNMAVKMLSDTAQTLKPLLSPQLDDMLALAAKETHPLHTMLQDRAIALGFTQKEATWLFDELKAIKYRAVQLVCADGFDDLAALLASISVGEAGLLVAGFMRFTGDPDTDKRIEKIALRFRENGATASVFVAVVIVWIAHTVARHSLQSTH